MSQSRAPPMRSKRPRTGAPPLSEHEQLILDLILSKGNDGILSSGIKFESKLPITVINKAKLVLIGKGLIKEVTNIKQTGRKVYMGASFVPSNEVSGGVWYQDGNLKMEFVGQLQDFCLKHIRDRQVDTLEGIHKAVHVAGLLKDESNTAEIAKLLTLMVLEDKIIEVKSTGLGAYYGIPVGKSCYRIASAAGGGGKMSIASAAFASIPCGMCPRVAMCTPDGVISPSTCVYYNKWLDIKINKP